MDGHLIHAVATGDGHSIRDGRGDELAFVPADPTGSAIGFDSIFEVAQQVAKRARNDALSDLAPTRIIVSRATDGYGDPTWAIVRADEASSPLLEVPRSRLALKESAEAVALADALGAVVDHAVRVVGQQRAASRNGVYEGMVGGPDLKPAPELLSSRLFRVMRLPAESRHVVTTIAGEPIGHIERTHAAAAGGLKDVLWAMDHVAGSATSGAQRRFEPRRTRSGLGEPIWSVASEDYPRFLVSVPRTIFDRTPPSSAIALASLLGATEAHAVKRVLEAAQDKGRASDGRGGREVSAEAEDDLPGAGLGLGSPR